MRTWTPDKIGSQDGKLAIVTGGTDGIGFETAFELARRGADVVIAGNRDEKGAEALERIHETVPECSVRFAQINTADLDSVAAFAESFLKNGRAIDILVNNAGVAGISDRKTSPQNFEWMFAANYLGHFALTARLFPLLQLGSGSRIVNVSSLAHINAKIQFDDLQFTNAYESSKAYGQSKLAMLLFSFELDRRIREANIRMKSIPVHPGGSKTNIFRHGRELSQNQTKSVVTALQSAMIAVLGQSASQGALPLLFAATAQEAESGVYYGPDGFLEIRGNPRRAKVAGHARDLKIAERLWKVSEELCGLTIDLPAAGRFTSESASRGASVSPGLLHGT